MDECYSQEMDFKMELKLNQLVLPLALSLASASVTASDLKSLTHEVRVNDYENGFTKTEWTLGKGLYDLGDNANFLFDVDKDYTSPDKGPNLEGWDAEFGLIHSLGEFAGLKTTLYYLFRYDATWEADNGDNSNNTKQYIIAPHFSDNFTLAEKDFDYTVELWAQVGNRNEDSLKDKSGLEANFYLNGELSEYWSVNLAWYNFHYYNKAQEEYDYQIGTEDYLNFTYPLTEEFTFKLESYLVAYHTPDRDATTASAHVEPQLKFNKKVNEHFSWHAEVSYEVFNWDYSKAKGASYDDNELEFMIGFKIK